MKYIIDGLFFLIVLVVILLMLAYICKLQPKTYWYVDRGWRTDWKCETKELARELAGSGRIYSREELEFIR